MTEAVKEFETRQQVAQAVQVVLNSTLKHPKGISSEDIAKEVNLPERIVQGALKELIRQEKITVASPMFLCRQKNRSL